VRGEIAFWQGLQRRKEDAEIKRRETEKKRGNFNAVFIFCVLKTVNYL
jgi:hypothetical protein